MANETSKGNWDSKYRSNTENPYQEVENNPVTFNLSGLLPNEAKWDIPVDKVKELVLKFSRQTLEDAKSVTITSDPTNGAVNCYLILPEDSPHLRDSSINDDKSAIRGNVTSYSPELKKFMERMCPDGARNTYPDMDNRPIRAIKIDLTKFFNIMFDRDGYEFQKKNKNAGRPRMSVTLHAKYDRIDKNKFSKLICITVVKSKVNIRDTSDFRPKKAHNIK